MNSRMGWKVFAPLIASVFFGCVSPSLENRLRLMETRQDSILVLLESLREKNDYMAQRMGWKPTLAVDTLPKTIPIGNSFTQGSPTATTTLVEFSDFQCPWCTRLSPVLDSLVRTYPKDVRLVFKHFPLSFHAQARAAAAAAIAAGNQGKFFEFRIAIAPSIRSLSDSLYLATAVKLGLDLIRFKKEMELTQNIHQLLDADMALGKEIGVEGTPTIFVNGKLAAERTFAYFQGVIEKSRIVKP